MTGVTGLVLAGGASRRMGSDKATLVLQGRTLLDRSVSCLEQFCDEVLVASGDGRRLPGRWRQVADVEPGVGPLGGLVAGLARARTELVAVLAVDLPDPSAPLLAWLAARRERHHWAVVPEVEGRLQPFHAVYATSARHALGAALAAGQRSITEVLRGDRDVRVEGPGSWGAVTGAAFATNVNTAADAASAGIDPGQPS